MYINKITILILSALMIVIITSSQANAQTLPWDVFFDDVSSSVCDLVNTDNAELVVLTLSGQLMLVTGDDIILQDTFVDLNGFVFFEGFPFGIIDFAEDGDGFRTLWWTTLLGSVIHIDEFTAVPSVSNTIVSDFIDVPCDASPFWDGCLVNADCDDNEVCTVDVCSGGVCVYSAAIAACDDGDACTTFDACINGVCVGTPIADCDSTNPPIISIDICGTGIALSMILTFAGLSMTRLQRLRFFY